jgi:hypothetical protein
MIGKRMFKVGDEVEVYNGASYRKAKVVALLSWPDNHHPVVVEFESFDGKPGFARSTNLRYGRFNHDGEGQPGALVALRHPKKIVVSNVYGDRAALAGPATSWCSEEMAAKTRGDTCVGYLTGVEDERGHVKNIVYTTLR